MTCLSTTFNIRKHILEVMKRGHFDTLDQLESCEPKRIVSVVNRLMVSYLNKCQKKELI